MEPFILTRGVREVEWGGESERRGKAERRGWDENPGPPFPVHRPRAPGDDAYIGRRARPAGRRAPGDDAYIGRRAPGDDACIGRRAPGDDAYITENGAREWTY